jgi:exodeoxyribonuclease VIII
MTEEIGPGIYPGMSQAEYNRIPGLHWSVLRRFKKSAKHARSEELHPPDPTAAMEFGNAFHRLVLEPDRFAEEYVVRPEDAPRRQGKANLEWWAKFEEANKGKAVLTKKEMDELAAMRNGLFENERAAELLSDPKALREVVVIWDIERPGEKKAKNIRCKGKLDLVTRWRGLSIVADVKTTSDASPHWFSRDLDKFDYAGQIVWYTDGLNSVKPLEGAERVPYFLAIEKEQPHDAVVYELGQASRDQARIDAAKYLDRYIEARDANNWPGLPDGTIELPSWAFKYEE